MTGAQKIIGTGVVVLTLGAICYQHRQVTELRVENHTLREQTKPLAQLVQTLQQERQRLHTELHQAKEEIKRTAGDQSELMRLRGEVTPLRQAAQELQAIKAATPRPAPSTRTAALPPAGVPSNLDVDHMITLRSQDLWQKLNQAPTNWIPELQFLKDEDWRKVALGQRWETDEETRKAFGQLRNAAKERFIEQLGTALQKYGQATAGQTPAKLADVASYFSPPVELNVLERYELIPQRDIPNVRLSQNPDELIVREKRALDPAAGETVQLINLKGTARGAIGDTRTLATPKP
ncbi:MAG: hypothetical protein EBS84_16270 [Proteobacteria bacterium]|nr:hypothetical protein [Verrucomicrobiota bacterium]NBU10547.1 hypothetical protein [Pseudomonadota bacterium]